MLDVDDGRDTIRRGSVLDWPACLAPDLGDDPRVVDTLRRAHNGSENASITYAEERLHDQFKADAVNLYERHPELSYSKAAADLGVGHATLKVWVRQARKDAGRLPTQAAGEADQAPETAEEELARLRVEVEALRSDKRSMRADLDRVTEERTILHPSWLIFLV